MGNKKYLLLYPFAILYRIFTDIRNILYDTGFLASQEFSIPVICVGNITVGGTGKTPHTEYLISILRREFKVAVLSRGYKRRSRGFMIVRPTSSVRDTGDEPLQIFRKFPDILVAVDRNRGNGIKTIIKEYPETDVIILDDGFQHRRVRPGLSILLTDYNRLITRDYLMPYGRLRENRNNRKRADIVVITKTPDDLTESSISDTANEVRFHPGQKIFLTKICYNDLLPVFEGAYLNSPPLKGTDFKNHGVVLITGIAVPDSLFLFLKDQSKEIIHLSFPDHHYFNENDTGKIMRAWETLKSHEKVLVTTEKDAVRLRELTNIEDSLKGVFYYIPVRIGFLKDGRNKFDNLIFDYVRKNKRDNKVP